MISSTIGIPDRFASLFNGDAGYGLLGMGLLLLAWQILALIFSDTIVASPNGTLLALSRMIQTEDFWKNLGITLERFSLSLLLGCTAGFVLGLIAGLKQNIRRILEPFRWSLMSIPPIVVVTLSIIWFGIGNVQIIAVTSILILPIMYINTIEGIEMVDSQILEMGKVYKANFLMILKEIYLPGMGGPVLNGLTLVAGLGIRVVVLTEVLGSSSGIGFEFSIARINMETTEFFAWILVCFLIVALFQFGILNPLRSHIMQWKT